MKKTVLFAISMIMLLVLTSCASASENEIHVVSREDGSGTRGAFVSLFDIVKKEENGDSKDRTTREAIIINKTDVMLSIVTGDKDAIGYVSYGSLSPNIKPMAIDGFSPSPANMLSSDYSIVRPFYIVTRSEPNPLRSDFISFILSSEGQAIVSDGYIPVNVTPQKFTSTNPDGKIVITGSSSVTPIMEKLVENYLEINKIAHIEILMTDSSTGIQSTIESTCDIGMVSRDLKEDERLSLEETQIALDGIVVIVNKNNPVDNLSKEQVYKIFSGEILDWEEVE